MSRTRQRMRVCGASLPAGGLAPSPEGPPWPRRSLFHPGSFCFRWWMVDLGAGRRLPRAGSRCGALRPGAGAQDKTAVIPGRALRNGPEGSGRAARSHVQVREGHRIGQEACGVRSGGLAEGWAVGARGGGSGRCSASLVRGVRQAGLLPGAWAGLGRERPQQTLGSGLTPRGLSPSARLLLPHTSAWLWR